MGITDVSRRSLLKGAALGAGIAALAAVPQTVHAAEVAAEAPAQGVVTVTAEAQGFGGPVSVTLTVDTATGGVAVPKRPLTAAAVPLRACRRPWSSRGPST